MFEARPIRRSELPCLVLFTEPDSKSAVILRIPDWEESDVWKFLEGVCDTIDKCSKLEDPAERLLALEGSLTSYTARIRRDLGHLGDKLESYVRAKPVKVIVTGLSI
jgi:hypothetical protein